MSVIRRCSARCFITRNNNFVSFLHSLKKKKKRKENIDPPRQLTKRKHQFANCTSHVRFEPSAPAESIFLLASKFINILGAIFENE